MKPHLLGVLGVSLGLTSLAWADEPSPPNPQTLGSVEAIISRCAGLDPAHAAQYRDQANMITQGVKDEMIVELRKSDEYRQAYDSATQSLAAMADAHVLKTCTGALAPER